MPKAGLVTRVELATILHNSIAPAGRESDPSGQSRSSDRRLFAVDFQAAQRQGEALRQAAQQSREGFQRRQVAGGASLEQEFA